MPAHLATDSDNTSNTVSCKPKLAAGYNLEDQLDPENVIQMSIKEQSISLYVVPGVPEDFPFKTKTRNCRKCRPNYSSGDGN